MSNGIGKDNHFAGARLYLQINERRAKIYLWKFQFHYS